jgi:hypothetical protein
LCKCITRGGKEKRRTAMAMKEGTIIKRVLDGVEFTVKKVSQEWVVLKSQNGSSLVMTDVSSLSDKSLYQKREDIKR